MIRFKKKPFDSIISPVDILKTSLSTFHAIIEFEEKYFWSRKFRCKGKCLFFQ
jgi:hypothetical protein